MNFKVVSQFLVRKWWVFYGISLVIIIVGIIIAIFGPSLPKPADNIVFYPWITLRETNNPLTLILLAVSILAIVLFALKKKSFKPVVLLGAVTTICCVTALALLGPALGNMRTGFDPDPTLTHVTSIRTSQHIYNLVRHQAFYEAIGEAFILYECDSLGINCHTIYRYKSNSLEDVYADMEHPPILASDESNVTLQIAGKVAYVYPISAQ